MFLFAACLAAGFAWVVTGSLTVTLLIAVPAALIWLARSRSRIRRGRVAGEPRRHKRSRLIGRFEYDEAQQRLVPRGPFTGRQQTHAPTPWCDGWCSDPNGKTSNIVTRRREAAEKERKKK